MIIFLDFDGVIIHSSCPDALTVDMKCLALVKKLCTKYNAKIIVSSTWRVGSTTKELDKLLYESGLIKDTVIGKTTFAKFNDHRGKEILDWMKENNYTGEYVAIDDEIFDLDNLPKENIMHIEDGWISKGLQQKHIDKWEKNRS